MNHLSARTYYCLVCKPSKVNVLILDSTPTVLQVPGMSLFSLLFHSFVLHFNIKMFGQKQITGNILLLHIALLSSSGLKKDYMLK